MHFGSGMAHVTTWALLILLSAPFAGAAGVAHVTGLSEHLTLTPHACYLVESDPLSAAEAEALYRQGAFLPSDEEWLELGLMDAVVWVAVELHNSSEEEQLYLQFRNPRMSFVDLYLSDEAGGYTVQYNGSVRPFSSRDIQHPMPTFTFPVAPGETRLALFRLENVGDFRIRVWLWGGDAFLTHISRAYYMELLTVGGLFVFAVFHLLVFISLRQWPYFFLSFFIFAWLFFYMAGTGLGNAMVWGDWPWLSIRVHSLTALMMNGAFVMFTLAFLETRRHTPRLFWGGMGLLGLIGVHFLYCCLTDTLAKMFINRYLALASLVYLAGLVAYSIWCGNRKAIYFLASWVFLLLGGLLILLLTWYIVPTNWLMSTPVINSLFTIPIILWSFEITGRIKTRSREQREQLAAEVAKRTRELEQALREVKTLSGLLPICSHCKKIRDDQGYWSGVEQYVSTHTDASFTHGICPDCLGVHYPDFVQHRDISG